MGPVAPAARAWIETLDHVRGLARQEAAPAGAWIETQIIARLCSSRLVAPPAGAWIENVKQS